MVEKLRSTGYSIGPTRVTLTELGGGGIVDRFREANPHHIFEVEERNSNYYEIAAFQIFAQDRDGNEQFLVDGGFTNWTQQLLGNRKERLLISGIGSERLCSLFAPGTAV